MSAALPVLEALGIILFLFGCRPNETTDTTKIVEHGGMEIHYVALGDSFTIGTGSSPEDAFPQKLVDGWTECPHTLKNLAKNGFTSEDVLTREIPALDGLAPSFVTIAVGANDIVRGADDPRVAEGAYRRNVETILLAVEKAGVPASRIVALPQPDWSLSPAASDFGDRATIATKIERFNAILEEEAKAAGARYIDIFPLMRELASKNEIASDGLHPSRAAHAAWAKAIGAELGRCGAL